MNLPRKNPKAILQNRFTEFQIRVRKIKNVIDALDNLEMELLMDDSTSLKIISEIKEKVWEYYTWIEPIIGQDSTLAFHIWSDQFYDDPLEAVSYPAYTLDMFDLTRVEKQVKRFKLALEKFE